MRSSFWLAVVAAAACGKSTKPAAATGSGSGSAIAAVLPDAAVDAAIDAPPPAPADKPCPSDDDAKKLQAKRLGTPAGATVEVICVAGHFPAPGWYLDTRWWHDPSNDTPAGSGDAEGKETSEILAVDGKTLIAKDDLSDLTYHQWDDSHLEYVLADLDGDGIDEIIGSLTWEHHGTTSTGLQLQRVKGGAFETIESELDEISEGGLANIDPVPECKATMSVDTSAKPARIVVDSDGATMGAACLAKGKHVFELKDGKLKESVHRRATHP
ncbi:MAG TPA: hypothetical protein VGM88_06650 [Kofleriaceae bacterium]|jgi:hypothetical protein